MILKGFTSSFVRTDTKDSDGNVTGFIEQVSANKQVDPVTGDTIFERSFRILLISNYELIEGTETEGLTTRTYGANWEIVSETTNTSSLPTITSTTGIPTALLDTTDNYDKGFGQNFSWGGSQTTYFDASSNVLGYSDTFVDSETNATNTNYNER